MKKFKKGDTIRLKGDDIKVRTYEVLIGTDESGYPPTAIRNDEKAFLAMGFVLASPEQYKLVHRPSKKDREIEQLQALVKESQEGYGRLQERAKAAEDAADRRLLEAGLVRVELLSGNLSAANWSVDSSGRYQVEFVLDCRDEMVREVARALSR